MSGLTRAVPADRLDLLAVGQGMKGQNYDRALAANVGVVTSGTVYAALLPLLKGDLLSNLHITIAAGAVSPTVSKVALFDKTAATRLAVSADLGTDWTNTNTRTGAMGTPYAVPTDDVYYAAFISVAGTPPSIARLSAQAVGASVVGSGVRAFAVMAGQSDMPASLTLSATAALGVWFGWS